MLEAMVNGDEFNLEEQCARARAARARPDSSQGSSSLDTLLLQHCMPSLTSPKKRASARLFSELSPTGSESSTLVGSNASPDAKSSTATSSQAENPVTPDAKKALITSPSRIASSPLGAFLEPVIAAIDKTIATLPENRSFLEPVIADAEDGMKEKNDDIETEGDKKDEDEKMGDVDMKEDEQLILPDE